jgi:hypothetical protein
LFLPTWRGWFLLVILFAFIGWASLRCLYPFLALNRQVVPAQLLVVEGWAPPYALQAAKEEFFRGHYRKLFVTGGPIEQGSLLGDYRTYANLGATTLLKIGFPADSLQAVPAPSVQKDRTYASARALRDWLVSRGEPASALNIVSVGAHCRRTHLLFSMAFGKESRLGILSIENRDFDPARWWRSSQGVRSVLDESIAYAYARLLFRP